MTRTTSPASRRLFLRQLGALSALGSTAAPLALNLAAIGSAAAQSASDYKALVCVFLVGGNDAFNTVLATDGPSWSNYAAVRSQAPDPISLQAAGAPANPGAGLMRDRLGGVLPIHPANAQGRGFALHPSLQAMRSLFDSEKRLAVVANVGPLIAPTSKAQYAQASHPKPVSLFSHNDQQNTWQTFGSEGTSVGWGGRVADMLASGNSQATFTAISATGNAVWLTGQTVRQYQVALAGPIRLGTRDNGTIYESAQVASTLQRVLRTARPQHVFEQDIASVSGRSIDAEQALRNALPPATDAAFAGSLYYLDPETRGWMLNPLAEQFQVIARMIQAGRTGAVGARRQVFFANLPGFDTHDRQSTAHAKLMAQLDHGMAWLDNALGMMGARSNVTTFTASDFGRTFTSNGDGTDHGWGAHHFVMGAAVRGGDIYGTFPVLGAKNANNNNFDSSPDQLQNGALLPAQSVEQYGATLARWFGLSDSQLNTPFPRLGSFSRRDLGFMA